MWAHQNQKFQVPRLLLSLQGLIVQGTLVKGWQTSAHLPMEDTMIGKTHSWRHRLSLNLSHHWWQWSPRCLSLNLRPHLWPHRLSLWPHHLSLWPHLLRPHPWPLSQALSHRRLVHQLQALPQRLMMSRASGIRFLHVGRCHHRATHTGSF